jgi:hypothetical protein
VRSYRVCITAQLTPMTAVAEGRLRGLTGASVKVVAVDIVRIEVAGRGTDAESAADCALTRINRALEPSIRFARPPVWVARWRGPLGLWRRAAGRWSIGDNPDDGLGGVREPRRPSPPAGSAAAAVDAA